MHHTFMVCLLISAGRVGYGIAALFAERDAIRRMCCIFTAKSAAILGLRHFTRGRTAIQPSKCSTHGGRKVAHMALRFKLRHVCSILFDVYHNCCVCEIMGILIGLCGCSAGSFCCLKHVILLCNRGESQPLAIETQHLAFT